MRPRRTEAVYFVRQPRRRPLSLVAPKTPEPPLVDAQLGLYADIPDYTSGLRSGGLHELSFSRLGDFCVLGTGAVFATYVLFFIAYVCEYFGWRLARRLPHVSRAATCVAGSTGCNLQLDNTRPLTTVDVRLPLARHCRGQRSASDACEFLAHASRCFLSQSLFSSEDVTDDGYLRRLASIRRLREIWPPRRRGSRESLGWRG